VAEPSRVKAYGSAAMAGAQATSTRMLTFSAKSAGAPLGTEGSNPLPSSTSLSQQVNLRI